MEKNNTHLSYRSGVSFKLEQSLHSHHSVVSHNCLSWQWT